jgi:hypothetical protein
VGKRGEPKTVLDRGPGTTLSAQVFSVPAVHSNDVKMRVLLALIIIIYLVGVGVVLAPTIRSLWNTAPASELAESLAQALPNALAWPVRAARNATGS